MGYNTDFNGQIDLDKPLTPEHKAYLVAFAETRRMKRNAEKTKGVADPLREAVKLPVGEEGEYFVGAPGYMGQEDTEDVVDHNHPPKTQPGLWCQWIPTESGEAIIWDGGDKFYHYVEWMEYIIENFLEPWGYVANGKIEWEGEERDDLGLLIVKDNMISTKHGYITYE